MANYDINLANGTLHTTVYPQEIQGGVSTPRAIQDIILTGGAGNNFFTLKGNLTYRFTTGFTFTVVNSSGANGTYTVASNSTYASGKTTIKVVSVIPSNTTPYGYIQYNMSSSTTLELPGRGTINYGEIILENLVHMTEHFARGSSPNNPLKGQLWYNTTSDTLNVYTGTIWESLSGGLTAVPFPLLANPIGTAGAPAYSFSGDSNTGMYSDASNELNFSTGGSLRLSIDTTAIIPTLPIRGPNGSASIPTYSFSSDTDTGLYNTAGEINWCNEGVYRGTLGNNVTANGSYYSQTGGYFAQDGLVGTPTYSFSNDTNTGIYRIGSDQLGISTGGVLRLTVSTSAITPEIPIRGQLGGVGAPTYSFDGDTNTGIYSAGGDQLNFTTGGTLRLTIESNGTLNVAGTSNYEALVTHDDDIPNKRYVDDAVGGSGASFPLLANPTGTVSAPAYSFSGDTDTGMYRNGADAVAFAIGAGRVGLAVNSSGISTYGGSIELGQAADGTGNRHSYIDFHNQNSTDYDARIIKGAGDVNFVFYNREAGSIVLSTNNNTRQWWFQSDGNVNFGNGILYGVATPWDNAHAANKYYVDSQLGNRFNNFEAHAGGSLSVNYTNTTGKAMFISIKCSNPLGYLYLNDTTIIDENGPSHSYSAIFHLQGMIPAGSRYKVVMPNFIGYIGFRGIWNRYHWY